MKNQVIILLVIIFNAVQTFAQSEKISSSHFGSNFHFGFDVDVDGDNMIVGAPGLGVSIFNRVLFLEKNANGWNIVKEFSPPSVNFGRTVAIDGDFAIAADRPTNSATQVGKVYVYKKIGTGWNLHQVIEPSDEDTPRNFFGDHVAISGDYFVVGTSHHGPPTSSDNNTAGSGAAYVYHLENDNWVEQARLEASDDIDANSFGREVAIDSNVIVIGSPGREETDYWGAAYVFRLDGNNWIEEAKLTASLGLAARKFGSDVDISQNTIAVLSSDHQEGFTMISKTYFFDYDGTSWNEVQVLEPPLAGGNFGFNDISIDGDYLAYGVGGQPSNLGGIFPNVSSYGYIKTYERINGIWETDSIFIADDFQENARMGTSVCLDGNFVYGGARNFDENGNTNSGAVYSFGLEPVISSPSNCQNIDITNQGFTLLGEFNNHKYFISDTTSNPSDAQIIATQNGGYLAVINDQAENDFILQNISDMAYIGLNDVQTEGTLVWENGEPFNYNNINPCTFCNENAADLDYVVMAPWDGTWSFSSQWNQRKYIVEIPCQSTSGGTPDLILSNPSGVPSLAFVDDSIDVVFDLENVGTGAVDGNYLSIAFLSTNTVLNVGDKYLGEVAQSNTPIGVTSGLNISFSIPDVPDGDYYILIRADNNNQVQELDDSNNSIAIPITIDDNDFSGCQEIFSIDLNNISNVHCIEENSNGDLEVIYVENDSFFQMTVSLSGEVLSMGEIPLSSPLFEVNNNEITEFNDDGNVLSTTLLDGNIINQFSTGQNGFAGVDKNLNGNFWLFAFERTNLSSGFTQDILFSILLNNSGNEISRTVIDTTFFPITPHQYHKVISTGQNGGILLRGIRLPNSSRLDEIHMSSDNSIKSIITLGSTQVTGGGFAPPIGLDISPTPCGDFEYILDINHVPFAGPGITSQQTRRLHRSYQGESVNTLFMNRVFSSNAQGSVSKEHEVIFVNDDGSFIAMERNTELYLSTVLDEFYYFWKFDSVGTIVEEVELDWGYVPDYIYEANDGSVYSIHTEDSTSFLTSLNCLSDTTTVTSNCPSALSGFTALGEYNGSKYFISDGASQPIDAQLIAQQNGGYLAVINDQAENDFLQQNITEMVYIGLNDVQTEGTLVWGNGQPLNYNNINSCSFCNENSADLDYVIMAPWDGAWSFSSQWNQRKYIVEIPCDNSGGGSITLNCPSDLELTTDSITGFATLVFPDVSGSTTCLNGGFSILNTGLFGLGDQVGVGVYTITYEAADSCNNVTNCSFDITVIEDNTGGGCPGDIIGFTTLGEYNGSKYYISDGILQPADAQLVAAQNGGFLAVINDQAENDFLQQNISEMVYIGLNDVQTEGTLVWENGDQLNYNKVNPCSFCNENSADLDYVIIAPWDGAWSFSSQWNQRKYIVEIPCDQIQMIQDPTVNKNLNLNISNSIQLDELVLKKLYPNPTTDDISLVFQSPINQNVEIQIFDARGVLQRTFNFNLVKGKNTKSLPLGELLDGFYSVLIPQQDGKHLAKRFVKIGK